MSVEQSNSVLAAVSLPGSPVSAAVGTATDTAEGRQTPAIRTIGANVYLFSASRQNRFLDRVIAPALSELRSSFEGFRFWFDRFDARGPHLFLLFSAAESRLEELRTHLRGAIEAGLRLLAEDGHGADTPDAARLEELHVACRGKALCELDRLPGMAEDGSFQLFDQPSRSYPFFLTPEQGAADGIWETVGSLTAWTLEQRAAAGAKPATAAALRLMAGLDHRLRLGSEASGLGPEGYWHHHLKTLMHEVDTLLEEKGDAFLEALAASIGEQNRRVFGQVWDWAESAEPVWRDLPELVDAILVRESAAWPLLREIVHGALKQLGLIVPKHLPIILFGWLGYRLGSNEAASAEGNAR